MKNLFVLLFIFVLVLVPDALAFKPQDNRVYKHLDALDKNGGLEAVSRFLNSKERKKYISSPSDSMAYGVWLRDIHFNSQKDLRYGFLYADYMKGLSQQHSSNKMISGAHKSTASMAYFISHLKLMNVISRCDDNSVGLNAVMEWSPKPDEYKTFFLIIPKNKQEGFFDAIVEHAEKAVSSSSVSWVCKDGAEVMNRAIQAGEEGRAIDDPNQIGNTLIIDTSKYIKFISDSDWKKKRNENSKKLKKYLLGK